MLLPLPFVPIFVTIFGMAANLDVYKYQLEHIQNIYAQYVRMKVIEVSFHGVEATLTFELYECGTWLSAASIFATLRLYNTVPFGLYFMFPFFAFTCLGISHLLLPVVASMHENSMKALAKWAAQLLGNGHSSTRGKYYEDNFELYVQSGSLLDLMDSHFSCWINRSKPIFCKVYWIIRLTCWSVCQKWRRIGLNLSIKLWNGLKILWGWQQYITCWEVYTYSR